MTTAHQDPPVAFQFGTDYHQAPDISLNLSHLRALLTAAYQQTENEPTTAQPIETVSWLLHDALNELTAIEKTYYRKPDSSE